MADQTSHQNNTQSSNQTDIKSGEIKGNQPTGQNERKPEHSGTDQERKEKSAIGGDNKGQSGNAPSGQSSDQTRANEKSSTETTGQGR